MPNVTVPVAIANLETVLERVASGERLTDIAAEYGRTLPAFTMALSKYAPDQYRAALQEQAEARMNMREEQLESAADGLSVSRARELLAHARWMLERRNPAQWAQMKQAVQVNSSDGKTQVNIVHFGDPQPAIDA